MEKLNQDDKDKLSRILHNSWDNVFKLLTDSSVDEYGVPYKEVYKYELAEREKDFPNLVDIYLESNSFFDRGAMKDWLIQEIVGALLRDTDCRRFQFFMCTNQLYDLVLKVIRPYYRGLYPDRNNIETKVIETNLSIKEGEIFDHQSRMVSVDNWEDYIQAYVEYDGLAVGGFRAITNMLGNSIQKDAKISNLQYDEFHLSCDIKYKDGWTEKKLVYKCQLR